MMVLGRNPVFLGKLYDLVSFFNQLFVCYYIQSIYPELLHLICSEMKIAFNVFSRPQTCGASSCPV